MDFGVVALEGLVSCSDNIHTNNNNIASFFPSPPTTTTATTTGANSHCLVTTAATSTTTSSDPDPTPKWYGSGLFGKQERPVTASEDDWRKLKMPRTSDDDFSLSKDALLFQNQQQNSQRSYSASTTSTSLLRSNTSLHSDGQQMLSFSSPNSQTAPTVAYFPRTSSASYGRSTGYGSAGFNASSMHGVKGPFTPSQWMELEHQALIFKYITANAPIPSSLLIPIRKALESAAFSTFPGAHMRHNPYGWGAFHMGFSGNSDPEPGRCRRTDGKKWRCSRDAVADQKYCERHMNRGRHRSRKPVEGQTGHSASAGGPTNTTAKLIPMSFSASPASGTAGSGASNSLSHLHNQLNGMQPSVPNLSASSQLNNRSFLNKGNLNQKNQENQYSILKQHINPPTELSQSEFGFVCSDSLLNPLHENTSLVSSRSYGSSNDLNNCEAKSQNSLRQFMDDWPHSDRTQLSISTPMAASSDFMSSTSSPSNEKLALSPLRLSRELDTTQMGLGMGARGNHRQVNWIPISWETSMGGPLGEVLHSTNNSAGESTNASPLNLMTEGWDSSPRMASTPTGVLQKTAFGSLSNSSAGSSPRIENNLLGSTLMNSSSLPAM